MTSPTSVTKILAARDSLEVIIEQHERSGMYLEAVDEERILDNSTSNVTIEDVNVANTGSKKSKVVSTRDSVILRKSSLAQHQQSSEFNISPRDSIELTKHTLEKDFEIKPKPSKLSCARNSIEILKESLLKLREPALVCQRKDQQQNPSSNYGFAETCCEQCKRKESSNTFGDAEEHKYGAKILKRDSVVSDDKSVKMSRVHVISLDDHTATQSVVSFHIEPKIYDTPPSTSDCQAQSEITKRSTPKKKPKKPLRTPSNQLKVIGDREANGDQSTDEFTAERIHSLIHLMKDHPQLLQLFTAGSR